MFTISLIFLTIICLYISLKSIGYFIKFHSPLSLIIFFLFAGFISIVYLAQFKFIEIPDKDLQDLIIRPDFYWFTFVLISLCLITLRQMYRDNQLEKQITDLTRKIAIEKALE